MQQPLNGKTALVTGGARGLGAALCEALASAGAKVVIGDINPELGALVARRLADQDREAVFLPLDVNDPAQVRDCVHAVYERHAALDILINNAGVDYTLPIEELDVAQWDRVHGTNLRGPFLLCRQICPHMKLRRCGHIVNIASTAAKRAWPNASAYHASKWGLLGFSHALHAELRPYGIKVTAVIAGGMRTPFLLDRFPDIDLATLQAPEAVAAAVLGVLTMPEESVVPEISVLPMRETSWP